MLHSRWCNLHNAQQPNKPLLLKKCQWQDAPPHFTLFLIAATAKALTTVLAGLALTFTSLPKAIRLPALVAGLCLVLTMQMPGMVNLPVLFTSFAASSAKASKAFDICDFFASQAAAKASAIPPLGMDLTPFIAFMPFFIAFIAFFAIVRTIVCLKGSG